METIKHFLLGAITPEHRASPRSAPAYSLGKWAGGRIASGISPNKKKAPLKGRGERLGPPNSLSQKRLPGPLPFLLTRSLLQYINEGLRATCGDACVRFHSGWSMESCRQLITSRMPSVSIDLCLKSLTHTESSFTSGPFYLEPLQNDAQWLKEMLRASRPSLPKVLGRSPGSWLAPDWHPEPRGLQRLRQSNAWCGQSSKEEERKLVLSGSRVPGTLLNTLGSHVRDIMKPIIRMANPSLRDDK